MPALAQNLQDQAAAVTLFQIVMIMVSTTTAAGLTYLLARAHKAIMVDRWRRIHMYILVPMNIAFYLMVARSVTALFVNDYPQLGIWDRLALPLSIRVLFFVGIAFGFREVYKQHEDIELRHQFVKHASHELNTPLALILGWVENALDNVFPHNGHTVVYEKIQQGGRRMMWVVENLLYTLTLSEDTRDIPLGRVDATGLVAESVEHMSEKIAYRQAHVSVKTQKGVVAMGSRRLLVAALTNLIDNAIKFADDTDIQVSVLLHQDNREVTFEVRDNGIGIGRETRRMIFDAFSQGDARDTRKYEGLGIGLWIVQMVARVHDGRVEIESELGQGSTFRLIVPRHSE